MLLIYSGVHLVGSTPVLLACANAPVEKPVAATPAPAVKARNVRRSTGREKTPPFLDLLMLSPPFCLFVCFSRETTVRSEPSKALRNLCAPGVVPSGARRTVFAVSPLYWPDPGRRLDLVEKGLVFVGEITFGPLGIDVDAHSRTIPNFDHAVLDELGRQAVDDVVPPCGIPAGVLERD